MTSREEFERLMTGLCEAYGHKPSARRVAVYRRALSDLTYDQLRDAFARVVRESSFFPAVAEIRKHVEPATDEAALLGWSALQRAAESVGAYKSLLVEDEAVGAAVQAVFGGWPKFCELTDIELATRRHEFMAAYRQARRNGAGVRRLQGLCEMTGQYQVSGAVWSGLLSASGTVRNVRDDEAQKLLDARPMRAISLSKGIDK